MGTVYLARDPVVSRDVAIKLMRAGMDDPADRQRFLREARSIGQLQHPNIVVLYDVGEHAGEPFIAMEYVNGRTLGDIMRQGGASLTDKIKWMEGICAGLFAAHRAGLIHRDIKPANVMVSGDGTVKVLDLWHRADRLGHDGHGERIDRRDARLHVARTVRRRAARLSNRHFFGGRAVP